MGYMGVKNTFSAKIERFEMENGWYYVPVPPEMSIQFEYFAAHFGFIAITAKVGSSSWATSLLPKGDGTYFIALPAKVRTKEKLSLGENVKVFFEIRERGKK